MRKKPQRKVALQGLYGYATLVLNDYLEVNKMKRNVDSFLATSQKRIDKKLQANEDRTARKLIKLNAIMKFVKSAQFKLVELPHTYNLVGIGSENSSIINLPKKVWKLTETAGTGWWFQLRGKYKTEALKQGEKDWIEHKAKLEELRKEKKV